MKSPKKNLPRANINLLLLAYIAFVALGLPTGLLGVAWPTLRADFSLHLDAVGFLFVSSTVGYLVSSFFIARLINRFGIGPLLLFSSLASAVALFGYPIAPTWSVIIALGCIGGFGSGLMDAGLNTYLAAEYNEGQMQWLHASFGIGDTLADLGSVTGIGFFTIGVAAGSTAESVHDRSAGSPAAAAGSIHADVHHQRFLVNEQKKYQCRA